jgi:hypothetical protein
LIHGPPLARQPQQVLPWVSKTMFVKAHFSQSTYKINSGCPYYKASISPNPKLMNDFEPSKEQLENIYGGIMEEVNELRLQITSKKILSAIDHQGKIINNHIAKVQAPNVVFWLLDDIEFVDWTTTFFY